MNSKRIDYINIGLIILSAILAYQFPLELFVIAFITLGPLHYFTEINWLDKKNYFISAPKRTWLWLGLVATILIMLPKFYFYFSGSSSGTTYGIMRAFNGWTNAFIFLSLIAAIGFVLIKKRVYWAVLLLPSVFVAYYLHSHQTYEHLIGIMIPTVIHVYIFTLLFMAYGAKKSNSRPGYFSVGIALFIPLVFAGVDLHQHGYVFDESMMKFYVDQRFFRTSEVTAQFAGFGDHGFRFYDPFYIKMMMFISFIYLYHYLNWFSKTSLIQWHKSLTLQRSIAIAATWIVLLLLFYFNLGLGMLLAVFFSMLHVILEFPLNVFSVKGLVTKSPKKDPDQ